MRCVYVDLEGVLGSEPDALAQRALAPDECLTVSAFERDEVGPAWVTTAGGAGLYEAVVTTLMERR